MHNVCFVKNIFVNRPLDVVNENPQSLEIMMNLTLMLWPLNTHLRRGNFVVRILAK